MANTRKDGGRRGGDRARDTLVVEAREIAFRAAASNHADNVDVGLVERFEGANNLRWCAVALDEGTNQRNLKTEARVQQLSHKVLKSFGARARDEADTKGYRRKRAGLISFEQTFLAKSGDQFLATSRDVAEESFNVDVGDGKPNLSLGRVDIDVAEKTDDHARLEGDAFAGQSAFQRGPGRGPAVRVQNRSLGIRGGGTRIN